LAIASSDFPRLADSRKLQVAPPSFGALQQQMPIAPPGTPPALQCFARMRSLQRFPAYPLWATLPMTIFVAVLVPVYWHAHGPGNFLWFSDIALFAVLIALWTGNRLVYSMMAVGVLPFEVLWLVDFVLGGPLGVADYMFDPEEELHLRLFSGFHFLIPPMIVWMLFRQGYDRRAWWAQTLLVWIVLPATWMLTSPEDNINFVHGLGDDRETFVPPLVYLGLYMALLPLVVILPLHKLMKRLFRA
jgi:hypothetical protein